MCITVYMNVFYFLCMLMCLSIPVCASLCVSGIFIYGKNEWVHLREFGGLFYVWDSITPILCFYQCLGVCQCICGINVFCVFSVCTVYHADSGSWWEKVSFTL